MRTIQITSACLVKGEHQPVGTVLKLDVVSAADVVGAGRGIEVPSGTESVIEHQEPVVQHRDPEPKKPKPKKAETAPAAPVATEEPITE
jgi:hypothetical protein